MRGVAVFSLVTKYSILFFSFAFLLNIFHMAFCDELVVSPETTSLMEVIGKPAPFVQGNESLFLNFGKVHSF